MRAPDDEIERLREHRPALAALSHSITAPVALSPKGGAGRYSQHRQRSAIRQRASGDCAAIAAARAGVSDADWGLAAISRWSAFAPIADVRKHGRLWQ